MTCAGTQSGANAPKSHRATDMRREPIVIGACAEGSVKSAQNPYEREYKDASIMCQSPYFRMLHMPYLKILENMIPSWNIHLNRFSSNPNRRDCIRKNYNERCKLTLRFTQYHITPDHTALLPVCCVSDELTINHLLYTD